MMTWQSLTVKTLHSRGEQDFKANLVCAGWHGALVQAVYVVMGNCCTHKGCSKPLITGMTIYFQVELPGFCTNIADTKANQGGFIQPGRAPGLGR
jgi:Rieske Fe-S protein